MTPIVRRAEERLCAVCDAVLDARQKKFCSSECRHVWGEAFGFPSLEPRSEEDQRLMEEESYD